MYMTCKYNVFNTSKFEKNQGAVLLAVIRYAPLLSTFSHDFGGLARHCDEGGRGGGLCGS
jgi:hypothetical protein